MKNYRSLIVWQKSMELVKEVYDILKLLPVEEKHALGYQIRKSSVSIPSNIAEGYGRGSTNDYVRFLQIARGSLYELQTQIELCFNLEFIKKEGFEEMYERCIEIEKMLTSLIKRVSNKA